MMRNKLNLNTMLKKTIFGLILLMTASLAQAEDPSTTQSIPFVGADASFNGDWAGGFKRYGCLVFVQTHFHTAKDGIKGTVDVIDVAADMRLIGKPLDKLELSQGRTHFELANKTGSFSFEGQITNGVMTGVVKAGEDKFPFRLDRIVKIDPSRYSGVYQVAAGHFITMLPTHFIASVYSFDSQSGQMSILFPRGKDDFVIWNPGAEAPMEDTTIHFTINQFCLCTSMQWKAENSPALIGIPIKLPEEEISFKNGLATLSGTLILPPAIGPYPAVVIVHGSGPGVRETYRFIANFFAMNGVAALIYDKRGCGTSTGNWHKSGFDDLAGDALAGLELLKNRTDINPHQIGLWGLSQGGWIVGLAASRSPDVSFIINVSGPGITPEEQGAFMIEHRMKTGGVSDADLREALSIYRLGSRCAQTESGWDEFKAACHAAQNKPWYHDDVHPFGPGDHDHGPTLWQLIWNYDPVPILRKVYCPVLAIFGAMDPLVPPQKSADLWKSALTDAGNQDVTVKIFPHADHGIADTRTGNPLPDYFTLQRDWLLKHVSVTP